MSEAETTRTLTGRVVSDKMDKTVTVLVERRVTHPMYGKIVTRSKKYHAHDEKNECGEGDLVMIEECRPISRTRQGGMAKLAEKGGARRVAARGKTGGTSRRVGLGRGLDFRENRR